VKVILVTGLFNKILGQRAIYC